MTPEEFIGHCPVLWHVGPPGCWERITRHGFRTAQQLIDAAELDAEARRSLIDEPRRRHVELRVGDNIVVLRDLKVPRNRRLGCWRWNGQVHGCRGRFGSVDGRAGDEPKLGRASGPQATVRYSLMSPAQVVCRSIVRPFPISTTTASSLGARWWRPRWGRWAL